MMRLEQTVHVTFRYALHFTQKVFGPGNHLLVDIISGRQLQAAAVSTTAAIFGQTNILESPSNGDPREGNRSA